jgi:ribonuclease E/ribonuclease G
MSLELLRDRWAGLDVAALVDGNRLMDVAADIPGQSNLYNSLWRVKIDRILPKVGAFARLGIDRTGLLKAANVRSGDQVTVQVRSVRGEGKADILSTDLAFAGQRFIYLPLSAGIKSSRRQGSPGGTEQAIDSLTRAGIEGGIIRSTGLEDGTDVLVAEAMALQADWQLLQSSSAIGLLRDGPDAAARLIADHAGDAIVQVGATFEQRGFQHALERLRQPRVDLGKGGWLMIERTSALTAIDVNTGTGSTAEINAMAAREIAHQIRLRNLSGLIVVDFTAPGPRHKGDGLFQALQKALSPDPAGCRIAGITPSGLVEITRPRRWPPLAELLETAARMGTLTA